MCLFDQNSSDLKIGFVWWSFPSLRRVTLREILDWQPTNCPGAVFRGMYIYKFNRIKEFERTK